ncbi:AraC family transcriptional regulator [Erwinia aphidicola]|uniref:AraC family transcriptional regulator n=1 Tax=Erwinia aphidicola TaxID=68334 RepID=A0ABU8DLP7_ERWAP
MDPITDLISRLKVAKQKTIVFNVTKKTSFIFPPYSGMKVYIVNKGPLYVEVGSSGNLTVVNNGDLFILSSGLHFEIFDTRQNNSIDVTKIRLMDRRTSYFTNGGSDLSFVGCRFTFENNNPLGMLSNLPEPIIVRVQDKEYDGLKVFLSHLSSEIVNPTQGTELVTEHLLRIILIKSLRMLISSAKFNSNKCWIGAVSDKNIGPVLTCIHNDVGRKWRIDELASIACMSRSAFTVKFRRLTGFSVVEYINKWRFNLAVERVKNNNEKISQIALELGYDSVSAFSNAFKKCMGVSPRGYMEKMVESSHIEVI